MDKILTGETQTRCNFRVLTGPVPMDQNKRNMTVAPGNEQQVLSDEDLSSEILSRLPVKSVIRCRCVCKAWRALISHPLFVNKYTSRHTKSKSSSRLLLPTFPLRSVDYEAPGVEVAFRKHYYPVSLPKPKSCLEIYGSCHGLVCLAIDYHTIILWNPSTGESNLLPEPTIRAKPPDGNYYGFGYDSTTQDYKIVRGDYVRFPEFKFEVFSLKTGSWRQHPLLSPTFELACDDDIFGGLWQGFLTNEALHWIDMSFADVAILVFSFAEEKFGRMHPNIYVGTYYGSSIGIVGDCLAVYLEHCRGDGVSSLWVMKEYGVEESWTQVLQFYPSGCLPTLNCPRAVNCLSRKCLERYPSGCLPGPSCLRIHNYPRISRFSLRPLCFLENGDLLLDNKSGHYSHFPIYDPKTQTFRDLIQIYDLKIQTQTQTLTLRNIDAGLWTPTMDEVTLEQLSIGPTIYSETLVSPLIGSM